MPEVLSVELRGKSKLYVAQSMYSPMSMKAVPHRHSTYEIAWLQHGEAIFVCDFQEHHLTAGSLVFIAPSQIHQYNSNSEYNLILVGFKASLFAHNWIDPAVLSTLPYFNLSTKPYVTVQQPYQGTFDYLFTTIHERYRELGVMADNYIELSEVHEHILLAYLHLILIEADRLYSAKATETAPSTASKQLVVAFQRKVEETYTERWRIQDYADTLSVTPNYLAEVSRQIIGQSPSEFVQKRLLLEAQRLLVFTDTTVAQIAQQLSFTNPSQFGQWFRKHTDLAPGKFRQQRQKP